MVKVSKKQLKIVDIVEEKNDEEGGKSPINSDVEELNNIKQEIENEEKIEEKIEKPDKKKVNAEYMKKYRKQKQEENKKIKEDLNNIKTKIIDKIAENPIEIQQPKIIERIVEKPPRIIKEPPDYNNIPEEIIQKEIYKRQENLKQQRIIKQQQRLQKLTMNIA